MHRWHAHKGPVLTKKACTVYPKKYAHGYCFAVLCCGYTSTYFPISIRLTSLALWQSNDCPSASKATLMNMDKYFMWIHYERLHNHNKAKHNKTVCIFMGYTVCPDVIMKCYTHVLANTKCHIYAVKKKNNLASMSKSKVLRYDSAICKSKQTHWEESKYRNRVFGEALSPYMMRVVTVILYRRIFRITTLILIFSLIDCLHALNIHIIKWDFNPKKFCMVKGTLTSCLWTALIAWRLWRAIIG